jgi:hypothetical protein
MDMSKDSGGDKEEMTMFLTKASLFCNARKDTEKEKGVDETDKGADEEENGKANEE